MKRPVFAGNWKMHHAPTAAAGFVESFTALSGSREDRSVLLFPPAISVGAVVHALRDRPDVLVGVQNIHWEEKGALTGEISAEMARDAGARVVLVGHSERRHVFGETDEQTALKCAAAVRAGLTPMLCVGELLEEREAGRTEHVVLRQLRAGLSELASSAEQALAIAYEPVWAIGTGRTATPDDAASVHAVLRSALHELLGEAAGELPILYGGSVNRGNVAALLAASDVDGVLVGGASLDPEGWAALIDA